MNPPCTNAFSTQAQADQDQDQDQGEAKAKGEGEAKDRAVARDPVRAARPAGPAARQLKFTARSPALGRLSPSPSR